MAERVHPAYSRHVKAIWERDPEELHQLFTAAEQVELLTAHPGWQHVLAVLEHEIATIDAELDLGQARSAEEYAKAHGRRSALRAPGDVAKAIIDRATVVRVRAEQQAEQGDAAAIAAERTAV